MRVHDYTTYRLDERERLLVTPHGTRWVALHMTAVSGGIAVEMTPEQGEALARELLNASTAMIAARHEEEKHDDND